MTKNNPEDQPDEQDEEDDEEVAQPVASEEQPNGDRDIRVSDTLGVNRG